MGNIGKSLIFNAKGIIFDLDGVIIDSIPFFRETKYIFLKKHGITDLDKIKAINALGMGMNEEIILFKEKLGLLGDSKVLGDEWREELYKLLFRERLTLLPGVIEFITSIQSEKKLAIATGGHTKIMAKKLMKMVKLEKFFKEIISSESDLKMRGKPYPDIYLEVSKMMGMASSESLVIEDAPNGAIAAKRAGMKVIGVNKDKQIRDRLKEIKSDVVVKSLEELI